MKLKKFLAIGLSVTILFNFSLGQKVKAMPPFTVFTIFTSAITAADYVIDLGSKRMRIVYAINDKNVEEKEIITCGGFKLREEATHLILDVINGKSLPIRVYGQDKAKKQFQEALAWCLENVYIPLVIDI